MRVLVTGAGGFIGRHLVRELEARGDQVEPLSRGGVEGYARPPEGAELLVHLAWITTPGVYLESPENLAQLRASLTLLERLPSSVRHVVIAGSCREYRLDADAPVAEDAPLALSPHLYIAAKHALHATARALLRSRGVSLSWARVFYPYGPGEHPARMIPSLRATLERGEAFRFASDGTHVRDFIRVEDVARALAACARPGAPELLNVGTGVGTSIREAAEAVRRSVGGRGELVFAPLGAPFAEPKVIVADTRALDALGVRIEHRGFTP